MKTYLKESYLYALTVFLISLPASPVIYGVQWALLPAFGRADIGYLASAALAVAIVGGITLVRAALRIRIDF